MHTPPHCLTACVCCCALLPFPVPAPAAPCTLIQLGDRHTRCVKTVISRFMLQGAAGAIRGSEAHPLFSYTPHTPHTHPCVTPHTPLIHPSNTPHTLRRRWVRGGSGGGSGGGRVERRVQTGGGGVGRCRCRFVGSVRRFIVGWELDARTWNLIQQVLTGGAVRRFRRRACFSQDARAAEPDDREARLQGSRRAVRRRTRVSGKSAIQKTCALSNIKGGTRYRVFHCAKRMSKRTRRPRVCRVDVHGDGARPG